MVVNIILFCVFIVLIMGAARELKFNYVEEDTLTPNNLRNYLEWENYGVVADLSRPFRGGAEVAEQYRDYYMLGEYADLLFLKEIFVETQNTETVNTFEKRLEEIRSQMPEYGSIFEKIEWSAKHALPE